MRKSDGARHYIRRCQKTRAFHSLSALHARIRVAPQVFCGKKHSRQLSSHTVPTYSKEKQENPKRGSGRKEATMRSQRKRAKPLKATGCWYIRVLFRTRSIPAARIKPSYRPFYRSLVSYWLMSLSKKNSAKGPSAPHPVNLDAHSCREWRLRAETALAALSTADRMVRHDLAASPSRLFSSDPDRWLR